MATLSSIRTLVKTECRENTTENDTYINQQINNSLQTRAADFPWKGTLVRDAAFTTATSTEVYALSSDFGRLVHNSVRWGISSTSQGWPLPDIPYEQSVAWKGAYTWSWPNVCAVVNSTTGTGKSLKLIPPFTTSGSAVSYDYYKNVSAMSADTSTLSVPELEQVVVYDACAAYSGYLKRDDDQVRYQRRAEQFFRSAFQQVLPNA